MTSAIETIDEAVREYLLWRGFVSTLRAFDADMKGDKDRGLQVERIVNQLLLFVSNHDLDNLLAFWQHLNRRFFCRLERAHESSIRKLEGRLKRYYVINCVQHGHPEKVQEFFEKLAAELQAMPEWRDWFTLPFIKNPETNPTFEAFFNRGWQDTFVLSLHNFLNTVFQSIPLPSLLNFEEDQTKLRAMAFELARLQEMIKADSEASAQAKGRAKAAEAGVGMDGKPISSPMAATTSGNDGTARPNPYASAGEAAAAASVGTVEEAKVVTVDDTEEVEEDNNDRDWRSGGNQPEASDAASAENELAQILDSQNKELNGQSESEPQPKTPPPAVSPARQNFVALSTERYEEHTAAVVHCALSPLGSLAATGDTLGTIKIWSYSPALETKHTYSAGSSMTALEWDEGQDATPSVFVGHQDGRVQRLDLAGGELTVTTGKLPEAYPRISALACKHQGAQKVLVCSLAAKEGTSKDGVLAIINPDTLVVEKMLDPGPRITSLHLNTAANLAVIGGVDGQVRLADLVEHKFVGSTWQPHDCAVCSVQFGPGDQEIFSSGVDGTVKVFGAPTAPMLTQAKYAQPLNDYTGQYPGCLGFSVFEDGDYLLQATPAASSVHPGQAAIFTLRRATDEPLMASVCTLTGHAAPILRVRWKKLATVATSVCFTASLDTTVMVHTLTDLSNLE